MDRIEELLSRGVENIIPDKEKLRQLLQRGKKLNVYLGIDPTATQIHIGHAVPLRKLQAFAELGHNVTFLIGDFTALIGDTSDKDAERPVLTSAQIQKNFETYKSQAEKILDFSKVKVRFNSEWLSKLTFTDIIKLTQHFSTGDFVNRELIRNRLNEGKKVGLHELLYPVMQGYDSYFMDTDIQLGGTDQTFNMQAGRVLQRDLRGKESFIVANGFLAGTDGRKMSKTWSNAVWLTDAPEEMFGKAMSLSDNLIVSYFKLSTNLSLSEINEVEKRLKNGENPMQLKKELAHQIVLELHSQSDADAAQKYFEQLFQKGNAGQIDLPVFMTKQSQWNPVDLLTAANLASSKSEAKRLIGEKAVEINNQVIIDQLSVISLQNADIIKVGKKKFLRIRLIS